MVKRFRTNPWVVIWVQLAQRIRPRLEYEALERRLITLNFQAIRDHLTLSICRAKDSATELIRALVTKATDHARTPLKLGRGHGAKSHASVIAIPREDLS